jgi:hypothetical protein
MELVGFAPLAHQLFKQLLRVDLLFARQVVGQLVQSKRLFALVDLVLHGVWLVRAAINIVIEPILRHHPLPFPVSCLERLSVLNVRYSNCSTRNEVGFGSCHVIDPVADSFLTQTTQSFVAITQDKRSKVITLCVIL